MEILKGLEAGVNKDNLQETESLIAPHKFDVIYSPYTSLTNQCGETTAISG